MLKKISQKYFKSFSCKDIDLIESMLSSEVILKDWDIYAEGKRDVLSATKNIFDSVKTIDVNILHIHEDITGILICEMVLLIDGEEMLVADVFEFDDKDLIKSLRAYKGN